MLPPMAERDPLKRGEVDAEQHFTQPPPRYSEASLVKKMEELGIGRPSTYASILPVLQDRNYVELDKRRFIPEDRGRLVTAFLVELLRALCRYRLHRRAGGEARRHLRRQRRLAGGAARLLGRVLARGRADQGPEDQRRHRRAGRGSRPALLSAARGRHRPARLPGLRHRPAGPEAGRYGSFIGCSNYPECHYTRPLAVATGDEEADALADGPRELGDDPATGLPVTRPARPLWRLCPVGPPREAAAPVEVAPPEPEPEAKKGKGKAKAKAKPKDAPKPKRVSLPKGMSPPKSTSKPR